MSLPLVALAMLAEAKQELKEGSTQMPTEIQITNRNALTTKKICAKLVDGETTPLLEFVIGPGEAVIIPMDGNLVLTLAEDEPALPA